MIFLLCSLLNRNMRKTRKTKGFNSGIVIERSIQFIFRNKLKFLFAITALGITYVPMLVLEENIKEMYTLSEAQYHILLSLSNVGGAFFFLFLLALTYLQVRHVTVKSRDMRDVILRKWKLPWKWLASLALIEGIFDYTSVLFYNTSYNFLKIDSLLQQQVSLDLSNPKGMAETILLAVATKSSRDEVQKILPLLNRDTAIWFMLVGALLIVMSWGVRYLMSFMVLEKLTHKTKPALDVLADGFTKVVQNIRTIASTDILIEIIIGLALLVAISLIRLYVTDDYLTDFIQAIAYVTVILRCYCYDIIFLESEQSLYWDKSEKE